MPAAGQSETEGFTVLRDATPPEFSQRRTRRSGGAAGRGCFAGLCKCLGPTEEEYGANKTRPHVIAQVGVNTSAPSSPKLVHGAANGGYAGAANSPAANAVERQSLQGPVPPTPIAANVQNQQMPPLPPLRAGLPKMHAGSQGEEVENSARSGETGVKVATEPPIQAPVSAPVATGRQLPQLPPRPDSRQESDQQSLHSAAASALLFGAQGTATPRVTHLQSASAGAAAPGPEGLAHSDQAYVEKDEMPSAALSIRRFCSQTQTPFFLFLFSRHAGRPHS